MFLNLGTFQRLYSMQKAMLQTLVGICQHQSKEISLIHLRESVRKIALYKMLSKLFLIRYPMRLV